MQTMYGGRDAGFFGYSHFSKRSIVKEYYTTVSGFISDTYNSWRLPWWTGRIRSSTLRRSQLPEDP